MVDPTTLNNGKDKKFGKGRQEYVAVNWSYPPTLLWRLAMGTATVCSDFDWAQSQDSSGRSPSADNNNGDAEDDTHV